MTSDGWHKTRVRYGESVYAFRPFGRLMNRLQAHAAQGFQGLVKVTARSLFGDLAESAAFTARVTC